MSDKSTVELNITEVSYVFDISSLPVACQSINLGWTNLGYDNTVVIVNSEETFNQYLACTSEIDFSQHTLLLASGEITSSIFKITVKDLLQLSGNEYELDIEITSNNTSVLTRWVSTFATKRVTTASCRRTTPRRKTHRRKATHLPPCRGKSPQRDGGEGAELFLYPNPTSSEMTVTISNPAVKIVEMEIHDIFGKKVHQQTINQSYGTLKMNELPQGVYILKVRLSQGDVVIRKVVKQ